jgi:hypothetical protein
MPAPIRKPQTMYAQIFLSLGSNARMVSRLDQTCLYICVFCSCFKVNFPHCSRFRATISVANLCSCWRLPVSQSTLAGRTDAADLCGQLLSRGLPASAVGRRSGQGGERQGSFCRGRRSVVLTFEWFYEMVLG